MVTVKGSNFANPKRYVENLSNEEKNARKETLSLNLVKIVVYVILVVFQLKAIEQQLI